MSKDKLIKEVDHIEELVDREESKENIKHQLHTLIGQIDEHVPDNIYGIQVMLNDIERRIIESEGEGSENRSKVGRAIDLLSQVEGSW